MYVINAVTVLEVLCRVAHTLPLTHSNLCRKRNLQPSTYVDTVNGTVVPASRWEPIDTVVSLGCRKALTRVRQ